MFFQSLYRILETQGVSIIGWIFAGTMGYGIYMQFPVILDRIDKGHYDATVYFAHSQEKFAKDILDSAKLRSQDLQNTLKAFRDDEREDRRMMVEMLRRSNINAKELSEAIDAATRPGGNFPIAPELDSQPDPDTPKEP